MPLIVKTSNRLKRLTTIKIKSIKLALSLLIAFTKLFIFTP